MLFRRTEFKIIILLLPMIPYMGCLDVPEEPKEYDACVDLIAFVASDTMEVNRTYAVQISFFHQCGQTSVRIDRTVGTNQITLKPVVHVNSRIPCPAVIAYDTITDSIHFSADTTCELWIQGRNATFLKLVNVVPSYSTTNQYSLRFRFQNVQDESPRSYLLFPFSILEPAYPLSVEVQADSLGAWDTTFVDTLPRLRYSVGGLKFQAERGIKDDGFILVQ